MEERYIISLSFSPKNHIAVEL